MDNFLLEMILRKLKERQGWQSPSQLSQGNPIYSDTQHPIQGEWDRLPDQNQYRPQGPFGVRQSVMESQGPKPKGEDFYRQPNGLADLRLLQQLGGRMPPGLIQQLFKNDLDKNLNFNNFVNTYNQQKALPSSM